VLRLAPQLEPLVDDVNAAIEELVWADAAVASRSGRAHPLAQQVEKYALGHAYSDPLDIGYLDRTGNAVGSAIRKALALGIPVDRLALELRELWARFESS
jgi:hypothetical protein